MDKLLCADNTDWGLLTDRENGFNVVLSMEVNLLYNLNKLRFHHAHLEGVSGTPPPN